MSEPELSVIISQIVDIYQNENMNTDNEYYEALRTVDSIYSSIILVIRNRRRNNLINNFPTPQQNQIVRNNPLEKSKVISKKKLDELCPIDCPICQDIPKYNDAILTECGHYYCKKCWGEWMNARGSHYNCPYCRKDMPKTTYFKARATKPKTTPVPFIVEY